MRVELRLGGTIAVGTRAVPVERTHRLLDGIARQGSVSGAAAGLGLSYRAAWEQLRDLEAALGQPVVVKTKGHGTVLTAFGTGLRDALAGTVAAFEAVVAGEARGLEARLAALLGATGPRLRLATSHDPLLLEMLASLPDLAVRVAGSEEAVGLLVRGEADLAGFHLGGEADLLSPALREAVRGELAVRPLFRREQGFIVAPGNPLGIGGVEDLARTRARYVNRQRGSGTRRWFDRLLAGAGLPPSSIEGYEVEEFTHQAVAALVAAGGAQAGMGLAWAARRFDLGFAPVGWETFFLAGRPDAMARLAPLVDEAAGRIANESGYAPAEDGPFG